MITITTWTDLRQAIAEHRAGQMLSAHAERLEEFGDQPLGELAEFVIVEPGDRLATLARKLGERLHPPPWEYAVKARGWYELVLVTGDDGFGYVVLVGDQPDTDPNILDYCRAVTT